MRTELTLRLGESLQVESVPIKIANMKWMQTVCATPYVDHHAGVTDLWMATESQTGARLPICPTLKIESLVVEIRRWVKEQRIDAHKWDRLIAKTRLFKSRVLKC